MRNIMKKLAPLSLALCASNVSAQDINIVVATLDQTTTSINLVSQSLLSGDVNGTVEGLGQVAVDLAGVLGDNTPLEAVTGSLPTNIGNTAFFVQDAFRVVEFAASNPLADGSLPVPLLGLVVGQGSIIPLGGALPLGVLQGNTQTGALSGLGLTELPLLVGDLDPATLASLLGGATLPGL
ncbi:hypothetical protein [Spectribacter hydrogenoxidans]|uniref:Uncharacterized protein n=1 Tax=Spectribacter hydrogenoxidans TaxID=3075608 RepID=A0ABU3C4D1_9GAMM|nr:hypothetical protein [Salinisphaera sp. W335]MDT0636402.1 hypothetical protein [Salinisphaera sp. W335]